LGWKPQPFFPNKLWAWGKTIPREGKPTILPQKHGVGLEYGGRKTLGTVGGGPITPLGKKTPPLGKISTTRWESLSPSYRPRGTKKGPPPPKIPRSSQHPPKGVCRIPPSQEKPGFFPHLSREPRANPSKTTNPPRMKTPAPPGNTPLRGCAQISTPFGKERRPQLYYTRTTSCFGGFPPKSTKGEPPPQGALL